MLFRSGGRAGDGSEARAPGRGRVRGLTHLRHGGPWWREGVTDESTGGRQKTRRGREKEGQRRSAAEQLEWREEPARANRERRHVRERGPACAHAAGRSSRRSDSQSQVVTRPTRSKRRVEATSSVENPQQRSGRSRRLRRRLRACAGCLATRHFGPGSFSERLDDLLAAATASDARKKKRAAPALPRAVAHRSCESLHLCTRRPATST